MLEIAKALNHMKTLSDTELQSTYWYELTLPEFKHLSVEAYSRWVDWILGRTSVGRDMVLTDLEPSLRKAVPYDAPLGTYQDYMEQPFLEYTSKDLNALSLKAEFSPYLRETTWTEACFAEGATGLATAAIFLFIAKHHKHLNFPTFLFAPISDRTHHHRTKQEVHDDNVDVLFRLWAQSRIYYMIHRVYLPLLLSYDMGRKHCDHATTCVYLPVVDDASQVTIWYRIFIDTSGSSFHSKHCSGSFNHYAEWESEALQKYQKTFSTVQRSTQLQLVQIFCVGDVQKNYGTCDHWSTLLSLLLVYEAPYVVGKLRTDATFLDRWFAQLVATSDKHMEHYLGIFLQLRKVFYHHFMNVLRIMAVQGQTDVSYFFAGVMYGMQGIITLPSATQRAAERAALQKLWGQVRTILEASFDAMDRIIHLRTPRRAAQVSSTT